MFGRSALAFWKARRLLMIPADTFAAPVPTSCSPSSVAEAGGTTVTIAGTNLSNASSVLMGGVAATSVTAVSDVALTCVAPAHAAGLVTIHVFGPGGQGLLADGVMYGIADELVTESGDTLITEGGDTLTTEN